MRQESEPADWALLNRFSADKDQSAFAELVRRHGLMVMSVCKRVLRDADDAEDAFQATFLVLARKAGAIRQFGTLSSWLYGVAVRIALNARSKAFARKEWESRVAKMERPVSLSEETWEELGPALHEELSRLPEKYRSPLVLCYLEGKTNEKAAEELGWPKGSISTRLVQARELLRCRLAQRGVVVGGALLLTLMTKHTVAAAVSSALAASTVNAAASGVISASVDVLVKGGLKAMMWAKLKFAAGVLMAATALGTGGGMVAYRALADDPPKKKQGSVVAAPAKREGAIPAQDFNKLVQLIQPAADESYWSTIPWMTDIREARKRAAAEGKPLFVWSLTGDGTGYC